MITDIIKNNLDNMNISSSRSVRSFIRNIKLMTQTIESKIYLAIIIFLFTLGAIGPIIAPYEPRQRVQIGGELARLSPPSVSHPLGTTSGSYDVLSLVLHGARPTIIAGIVGGSLIITFGLTVGIVSGYIGGWVDNILMRFTDLMYGIPLIPFALVIIGIIGIGFFESIVIISAILWRGSARVIRSEVLKVKQEPYIMAARVHGAGTRKIMISHILPNVAPMGVLFFALGVGYTIIIQAGLSFIGVVDPFTPSWGVTIRNAYNSGAMGEALWWSLPPSLLISLTVVSVFMFGREYERILGRDTEGTVEGA